MPNPEPDTRNPTQVVHARLRAGNPPPGEQGRPLRRVRHALGSAGKAREDDTAEVNTAGIAALPLARRGRLGPGRYKPRVKRLSL